MLFMEKGVNKLSEMRSTSGKLPKLAPKNPNESVVIRLRKLLKIILSYRPNFLENIKKISVLKVVLFIQSFLDCLILNNQDL